MNLPNPTIIAAIIGAVVAVGVFVVRDLIVASHNKSRTARAKLVEEKLSKIYSPLMSLMGTKDLEKSHTLAELHYNDQLRSAVSQNLHLLSPLLRDMITEALSMGRWRGANQGFTSTEQGRLIEMTEPFRSELFKEFEALQKEHSGS